MQVGDILQHPRVLAVTRVLEQFRRSGRAVSDVRDGQGNQYVDLVMEGGGVLGIALVGYTHALESAGVRFRSIGGTSAGAINALLLAAVAPPGEPKSGAMLRILADLQMFSFVDGGSAARRFVRAMVERRSGPALLSRAMPVVRKALCDLGLNPGDAFESWLERELRLAGVNSTAALLERMRQFPPGMKIDDANRLTISDLSPRLAIVAADLTTESKVVFPEMAEIYFEDPAAMSPARFVRASMSIPGFFHPYRVGPIPWRANSVERWKYHTGYEGRIPEEVVFVDGGVMSNFPISLFHVLGEPRMPTFGVKLGVDRSEPRPIHKAGEFAGALFDAARHCADFDFLYRNPDYRSLMTFIETGEHNWLDFFMGDAAKIDLFALGLEAGADFIQKFDWERYQKIRKGMAKAMRKADE
jgi:NTE family protein